MAELRTIARPYAKAAFQTALAKGELPAWASALVDLSGVTRVDKVEGFLKSPGLTADAKAEKLLSLCGESFSSQLKGFVRVLADFNRLTLLPEISSLFDELKSEHESNVNVVLNTAYPLDTDTESKIISALKSKLNRDVTVETAVDSSLLGGALIKVGDAVIDGSIKGRLNKLATAMNS